MIYGPIISRTEGGLSEVVLRAPERLEDGLQPVVEGLRIGGGILVDAIARDAAGLPVLVFLAPPPDDRTIPARVSEALSWFDELGAALRDLLQRDSVRLDGGVRAIVACFDLSESTLRRLRDVGDPRISVLRLEPYEIAGTHHLGVVPLLDRGRPHIGARVTDAGLPTSLEDMPTAGRFLDLLNRLDPAMEAAGDRYHRRFSVLGKELAVLCRRDDRVEVQVVGHSARTLATDSDVSVAFDRLARRYLAVHRGSPSEAEDHGPRPTTPRSECAPEAGPRLAPAADRFRRPRAIDAGARRAPVEDHRHASDPGIRHLGTDRHEQAWGGELRGGDDAGRPPRQDGATPRPQAADVRPHPTTTTGRPNEAERSEPSMQQQPRRMDPRERREDRPPSGRDDFADSCGPCIEAPESSSNGPRAMDDDFDLPILDD